MRIKQNNFKQMVWKYDDPTCTADWSYNETNMITAGAVSVLVLLISSLLNEYEKK